MEASVRSPATAVRISLGIVLGFLGAFLFGVVAAHAADDPANQHSSNASSHSVSHLGNAHATNDHPRQVQRTLEPTSTLVRGTRSVITNSVKKATQVARSSKATKQKQGTTVTVADQIKRPTGESVLPKPDVTKAPESASKPGAHDARRPADVKAAHPTPAEVQSSKAVAQELRASVGRTTSEVTKTTGNIATSKAAAQKSRETTAAATGKVRTTAQDSGDKTPTATKERSSTGTAEMPRKTLQQAASRTTASSARLTDKGHATVGKLLQGEPLEKTVDAVVQLPAKLAVVPPVKETLTATTTTLDTTVARVPVVNKILPQNLLTETSKPVADLADRTVKTAVTPVLTPAAHVTKPILKPVASVVKPVISGAADTVDAVVAPVVTPAVETAAPVLGPIAGVEEPVLGNVGGSVDPVLTPMDRVVAPVLRTEDAVLDSAASGQDSDTRLQPAPGAQPSASTPPAEQAVPGRSDWNSPVASVLSVAPAIARVDDRVSATTLMHAAMAPEDALRMTATQPSSLDSEGPAVSNETKGNTPAPQRTPAPLAAQGTGASVGSGGGPQTPLGAFQNSSFNFTPNMVSGRTVETGHQGPRGTANDPGSTPD